MTRKVLEATAEIAADPVAMKRFVASELRELIRDLNSLLDVASNLGLSPELQQFNVSNGALSHTTQFQIRVLEIQEIE